MRKEELLAMMIFAIDRDLLSQSVETVKEQWDAFCSAAWDYEMEPIETVLYNAWWEAYHVGRSYGKYRNHLMNWAKWYYGTPNKKAA